jgi:alpha-methylacyl-CoA racemase
MPAAKRDASPGPLAGLKVVEMAGLGPAPMTAMLLADLGATVIRIDRKVSTDLGIKRPRKFDLLLRNRDIIGVDLKEQGAVDLVLELVHAADVLIEGFRPGVMERLGLGPERCLQLKPSLVYGRVTGWGQSGPLAQAAGHDLNYVALTGAINAMGRKGEAPTVPLSLIGDFGGGALYLAFGVMAALFEAAKSGKGQVVDAAMVDGAISLQTIFLGMHAAGIWSKDRGNNLTDSGSHFYDVYQCKDGEWISVAALEQRFYDQLLSALNINASDIGPHQDPKNWEKGKALFAARFKEKTREEWCKILEGTDTCFAPVLSWDEAAQHPHLKERQSFCEIDGVVQPAVAPRFSRSAPNLPRPPQNISAENSRAALSNWLPAHRIEALFSADVVA